MSVVGTSTNAAATALTNQRLCFWALGRFGVFYTDGTDLVWETSLDGVAWGGAVQIARAGCNEGMEFSIWFDSARNFVHYAYCPGGNGADYYYGRGTPNADGTITWTAEQTIAVPIGEFVSRPSIAVDSDNYPFITYRYSDGITVYPRVTKSSTNDGTWVTEAGFPFQLNAVSNANWMACIVPLTNLRMVAVYTAYLLTVRARRYTGAAWGAERTTVNNYQRGLSVTSENDNAHVVWTRLGATWPILHSTFNYAADAFGAEIVVHAVTSTDTGSTISVNKFNLALYVFWGCHPLDDHVYYSRRDPVTLVWSVPTDWIDETADNLTGNNGRVSAFFEQWGCHIGLAYVTLDASPYNVKFEELLVDCLQFPGGATINAAAEVLIDL